jgi:DNA repair photolyase
MNKTVFGTKEWASHNENCISGCSNHCRYCYAQSMAVRFGRKTPDTWKNEILHQGKLVRRFKKKQGRFMFPTTHDITPENFDHCMVFLENILKAGNEVLVVSKPHLDCIRSMCNRFNEYRQQILFRFTIGSADNDILRFWDQDAPGFEERLESLAYAYRAGYATSVSCEPLLDANADDLIRQVRPYVTDAIWLGKGNNMIGRLKMNGHGDQETIQRAVHLMASLSAEYVLDLYDRHRDDPHIKWKDSLKKVVGIEISVKAGLDI